MRPRKRGTPAQRPVKALDCETVHDKIVLFLASDGFGNASYLYKLDGLQFDSIAEWLISHAANLCIGYFFDYDVQQIVRQLPSLHLHQLWKNGRVIYKNYRIRHIPRKRFSITDLEKNVTCTIWDVSGWTQCSFAKLITDWQIGSENERRFVKEMKAKRDDLSNETKENLVKYTTLECKLLCIWFEQMLQLHKKVEIHLTAYSGAGSTAGAMFRKNKWKPPEVPEKVQFYAEQSFFGGRSEISRIGPYTGSVYGYDINSAYPFAIVNLPEIRNKKWYFVKRYVPEAWGFYKVRWKQKSDSCWGLFPLRGAKLPDGRRSLSLLFPIEGEGIYHSYEIEAAMNACPECLYVVNGWIIEPEGFPFQWVKETIAERLALKQNADPAHIVLKLGLNSLYGKLAQHSGEHPLQCMVYASAITAKTRSMMLPLLLKKQHKILIVATDGILSTEPLDLPVSGKLGDWELTMYENAWILQSGVYWAGNKIRTRGIDQRGLDLEQIKNLWRKKRTSGELKITVKRVVSYRSACARNKPELTGAWVSSVRAVRFSPAPRRKPWRWTDGALLTLPADVLSFFGQALTDALTLEADATALYDEDALPDWCYD